MYSAVCSDGVRTVDENSKDNPAMSVALATLTTIVIVFLPEILSLFGVDFYAIVPSVSW